MKNKEYIPIDCSFYDRLEHYATLKASVPISYTNDEGTKLITGIITDLRIIEKVEYAILRDIHGQVHQLRLDHIASIDGHTPDISQAFCSRK